MHLISRPKIYILDLVPGLFPGKNAQTSVFQIAVDTFACQTPHAWVYRGNHIILYGKKHFPIPSSLFL